MDKSIENIALLHLMNKDASALSMKELCALYIETVEQVAACYKEYQKETHGPSHSFT